MTLVVPIKLRVDGTSIPAKLNAPISVTTTRMMMIMILMMKNIYN